MKIYYNLSKKALFKLVESNVTDEIKIKVENGEIKKVTFTAKGEVENNNNCACKECIVDDCPFSQCDGNNITCNIGSCQDGRTLCHDQIKK